MTRSRRFGRLVPNQTGLSSLHGLYGGGPKGMSATAFQKKRRELQEQASVAARLNEDGKGDPYAKTLDNYDEQGVKDEGTKHQEGNPPPYSETPHTPENLSQEDQGTKHQEGDPPFTSVELRDGEKPKDGVFKDQAKYDALDKRESASAEASEKNAETGDEKPKRRAKK